MKFTVRNNELNIESLFAAKANRFPLCIVYTKMAHVQLNENILKLNYSLRTTCIESH